MRLVPDPSGVRAARPRLPPWVRPSTPRAIHRIDPAHALPAMAGGLGALD
ncbi:MAG: hypothetical protein AAF296_11595 [Pseudomonadota bacterium]